MKHFRPSNGGVLGPDVEYDHQEEDERPNVHESIADLKDHGVGQLHWAGVAQGDDSPREVRVPVHGPHYRAERERCFRADFVKASEPHEERCGD